MNTCKPVGVILVVCCLVLPGCLTYYPGTQYERKVPLGGYVGGVAGTAVGGTMALLRWKGDDLSGDDRVSKRPIGVTGQVLASAGVVSLVSSVVYELVANKKTRRLPVAKYPMVAQGSYGYHRATGKRLFVKKVTADYDEQGNPYNHYYACEHTGLSADCWWLREWDLAYKRVYPPDPSKDIPEPPEGLHGLPYLEETEESPAPELDPSGLPVFIDLKKIKQKTPLPRYKSGQELFLKNSGQLVRVQSTGYRLDENREMQICYQVCWPREPERECRVMVEDGLED